MLTQETTKVKLRKSYKTFYNLYQTNVFERELQKATGCSTYDLLVKINFFAFLLFSITCEEKEEKM